MEKLKMKQHPAWLATGLLVFVVLACSLGKNANTNTSSADSNSNASTGADSGSGSFIKEIHMAKDDGGSPGDRTSTFAPGDRTVHCVTTLKEPKAGTKMKFAWWIVDAEGSKNQQIKDIDYTTGPLENVVHGHLTVPRDWPQGKYKVEVFINGDLDKTVFYSVQ
jgi:hypothetical protein